MKCFVLKYVKGYSIFGVKIAINEDYRGYGLISNLTKMRPICGWDVVGML
jgi:hypothetical protein